MQKNKPRARRARVFTADEGRLIWKIAQKIPLGDAIPAERADEVRAELRDDILTRPHYFAGRGKSFRNLAEIAMRHHLIDIVNRLAGRCNVFFASFQPYDLTDPETDETYERDDVLDGDKTDDFYRNLDRKYTLRGLRNWRRRFRARLQKLNPEMRRFVHALDVHTTQNGLSAASGIGRKGCYLRRRKLQAFFADLLADWQALRARL